MCAAPWAVLQSQTFLCVLTSFKVWSGARACSIHCANMALTVTCHNCWCCGHSIGYGQSYGWMDLLRWIDPYFVVWRRVHCSCYNELLRARIEQLETHHNQQIRQLQSASATVTHAPSVTGAALQAHGPEPGPEPQASYQSGGCNVSFWRRC